MAHSASWLCDSDKFLTGSSLLVLNQAWSFSSFFFILLANDCRSRFSSQPTSCCGCRWMSDLLSNVLPRFAVASFGLRPCEAESAGLQVVVDLFCPNFLGRRSSVPPVNRTLSPEQLVRRATRFHSADVAKPVKSSLLDLRVGGRLLLASFADGFI